jgi:hypothetical protein
MSGGLNLTRGETKDRGPEGVPLHSGRLRRRAGEGKRRFAGLAYSGKEVTDHPFWPKVIFDLASTASEQRKLGPTRASFSSPDAGFDFKGIAARLNRGLVPRDHFVHGSLDVSSVRLLSMRPSLGDTHMAFRRGSGARAIG